MFQIRGHVALAVSFDLTQDLLVRKVDLSSAPEVSADLRKNGIFQRHEKGRTASESVVSVNAIFHQLPETGHN
jgi:hypothetical protein